MMDDGNNDLSDLLDSSADGEPVARIVRVVWQAPAKNSIEFELMGRRYSEPGLMREPEFIEATEDGEIDVVVAAPDRTEPDEMADIRQALSDYWSERISLARSLPHPTWESYRQACKEEGLEP
jgi:hypothetical protein